MFYTIRKAQAVSAARSRLRLLIILRGDKMMKRVLCALLLVFSSLIFFVSCNSSGGELDDAAVDNQGLKFYLKEDGTYAVSLGDESRFLSKIVLPETYCGKPVNEFTYSLEQSGADHEYIFNLQSITISKSITKFNVKALRNCFKLVEVINHSELDLSYLKDIVFDNWHQILEVHSDKSKIQNHNGYNFLTSNGINYLLSYNGNDKILTLPENYKGEPYQIADYAFYHNIGFTCIRFGRNVSKIGMNIIDVHPSMRYLESICYEGSEEEFFQIPGYEYILYVDPQYNCAIYN